MEIKETRFKTLVPSAGHVLTQKGEVDILSRVFSTKIRMGIDDPAEGWTEITEEEAEELHKAQHEELERISRKEAKERQVAELEAQLKALKDEQG